MNIIFKYSEKIALPDKYASIAKPKPIIAADPAAKPSRPSVIFAPLETEVMMKMTMKFSKLKDDI